MILKFADVQQSGVAWNVLNSHTRKEPNGTNVFAGMQQIMVIWNVSNMPTKMDDPGIKKQPMEQFLNVTVLMNLIFSE